MKKSLVLVLMLIVGLGFSACSKKDNLSTPTVVPTAVPTYVISFQQGVSPTAAYSGAVDNCLISNVPTSNFGSLTSLSVGNASAVVYRMLIRFDLSAFPVGASATRAELVINVNDYGLSNSINAYAVSQDWDAGTSSWNKRNSTDSWTTPGGDVDTIAGTLYNGGTGEYVIPIMLGYINSWLDYPPSNHGLLLMSADEGTALWENIDSCDQYTSLTLRPTLKIYYIQP